MNKLLSALLATALMGSMATAVAADKAHKFSKMDANNDGMVSQTEYNMHNESRWSKWKKNADGMVDVKEIESNTLGEEGGTQGGTNVPNP